jgi:hypothetical protein
MKHPVLPLLKSGQGVCVSALPQTVLVSVMAVRFSFWCFAVRSGAKINASETRMNAGVRGMAMLLLTLTAAVSVAGQESTLMLPVSARPAICHRHGAKPSAPTPVSYRCCQSGHDSAILQTPLTTRLCSAHRVSTGASISAPISVSTQSRLQSLTISSPDPPRTIPLRV